MFTKIGSLALLSLILSDSVCLADHFPPESQARGKPEKRLAGIHLGRTKVADVIRLYGKPTEVKEPVEFAYHKVVPTYDYYWIKPGMKLHLVVYRGENVKGGEQIALIEVEGSRTTGGIARTGSGLKLGDSPADLKRIYGKRFREQKLLDPRIHNLTVHWRSEEYSLQAQLDLRGRIIRLSLSSPE